MAREADQFASIEKLLRHAKFSIPKQHSTRHRPQDSNANPFASFVASVKLDTSQVEDRRDEMKHNPRLYRFFLNHVGNPSDITDRRLERPAPKTDSRIGAAGRHNAEDRRGAMSGDGRLERPAPKAKPKPKLKPRAAMPTPTPKLHRFNNGRDA